MQLSICIPTYNRVRQLDNCLNSILIASKKVDDFDFEICVSDNASKDDVNLIIEKYKKDLNIKFNKNKENLGFAVNALKSINLASGKFAWFIGDDDLILPQTLHYLKNIFNNNLSVEYFFINSYHLNINHLKEFSHPFDTNNLQDFKMKKLSYYPKNHLVKFWDIIDPNVSWEFLIGIFLSIFKRDKWLASKKVLNMDDIKDTNVWSNFDNTCMNAKIIANAFKDSKSYICAEPLSVNLFGQREWGTLYEFIEIVRIPELIDHYRKEGLPLKQYLYCKNYSLRNFVNFFAKILLGGKKTGLQYVSFKKHILKNLIFPYAWLSLFFFIYRKLKKMLNLKKL